MVIESKTKTRVIGVDIDMETTTVAIVDIRGDIIARDSFRTVDYQNVSDFIASLAERIIILAETNGGFETIRSVGISCASANFFTGCIENAANMPWKGIIPLAAMLRDRLGLAVALANDAHVSGLGEHTYGSAHGMKDFIVLSLGHGGLGSCVFSGGQLHLGYHGFAGEVGHTCVEPGGRLCGCGHRGCLEEYTTAKGMALTAHELLATSDAPSVLRSAAEITPALLAEACEQGDEIAIEVLRISGEYLGLGLANYASLINPEAIILTGDIRQTGHWMIDPLCKSFEEHVFHNIRNNVRLIISILNDADRSVLGASALAWEVKEYSLFK